MGIKVGLIKLFSLSEIFGRRLQNSSTSALQEKESHLLWLQTVVSPDTNFLNYLMYILNHKQEIESMSHLEIGKKVIFLKEQK